MKARLTEYEVNLKTLAEAQEVYYLANGQYATELAQLDVDIPACKKLFSSWRGCAYRVYSSTVMVSNDSSGISPAFIYSLKGNSVIGIPCLEHTLVCTHAVGADNCQKMGFTQQLDGNGPPSYVRS